MSLTTTTVAMAVLDDSARKIINEGHLGQRQHKLVLEQIRNVQDFSDPDVLDNMVWHHANAPSCLLVIDSLTEDELIQLDADKGEKNKGILFSQIVGMLSNAKLDNTSFADRILNKALKVCTVNDNVFMEMRLGKIMDDGFQDDASDYDRYLMFLVANINPEIQVFFSNVLIDRIKNDDDYFIPHTRDCMDTLKQNDSLYDAVKMTITKHIMGISGKSLDGALSIELSLAAYSGHDWIKPFIQSYLDIKDQETQEKTDLKAMIAMLKMMKNSYIYQALIDFSELISSKGYDFINRNLVDASDLHTLIEHDIIDQAKIRLDENTSSELKRAHISIEMGL